MAGREELHGRKIRLLSDQTGFYLLLRPLLLPASSYQNTKIQAQPTYELYILRIQNQSNYPSLKRLPAYASLHSRSLSCESRFGLVSLKRNQRMQRHRHLSRLKTLKRNLLQYLISFTTNHQQSTPTTKNNPK